eukprot:gene7630-8925_t
MAISAWRSIYLHKKSYHDFNNTVSSVLLGSLQEIFHFFINPLFFIPYLYIIVTFSTDSWLSFIISFLCVDFSVYAFHRLGHETNFFWAIHVPHHSSDFYNFSSATRQGILQYIFCYTSEPTCQEDHV